MQPQMRSIELDARDKRQLNAAFEATKDVTAMVEVACGKVLARHGVEDHQGPYSMTWNHGEQTVTLNYFIT